MAGLVPQTYSHCHDLINMQVVTWCQLSCVWGKKLVRILVSEGKTEPNSTVGVGMVGAPNMKEMEKGWFFSEWVNQIVMAFGMADPLPLSLSLWLYNRNTLIQPYLVFSNLAAFTSISLEIHFSTVAHKKSPPLDRQICTHSCIACKSRCSSCSVG